ncbi:MAG: M42 family metallopeptidase [Candidatus Mcinerneyibacterium aminivorans]|uniref:M42 family metallopeptidase n=1 Tax=Candidatus Mcinerneyibacterium aminivorans TaxID=2703815 RepID=A0A5D0MGK3_9BACT|nr:MAG: M42 family metallopeptidase [Candidatus Mcinerneyibacterium aminivorans]
MGNLYAYKNSKKKNAKKVLVIAHMDEIGFMIDHINKQGFLNFQRVGGIDPRLLVSKKVVIGEDKIPGVIGAKPIHLQKRSEWKKPIPLSNLYIDIGASSEKDAKKVVSEGDFATFDTGFEIQEDTVSGKAFDDRAGCGVITEILKGLEENESYPVDIIAVFTVQEEVGLRGASVLAERVRPDYVLAFEGTTAGDVPDQEDRDQSPSTEMRKGPAITVMDRTTIGFRQLKVHIEKTADKYEIPYQYKRTVSGGTDIGVIHTQGGIPSIVISTPVRYIHAPRGIMATKDYENTVKLAIKTLKDFKEVL